MLVYGIQHNDDIFMCYKVNINLSYSHKYNPIRYWYTHTNKMVKRQVPK